MRTRLEREAAETLARLDAEAARRRVRPACGIDFASNDYLGLSRDPRVVAAAARALREEGFGAGASRLLRGDRPSHRALEERMAAFRGAEDGLLFPSGFHANLGVLQALGREGWTIASDEGNHASIVEGCRAAKARTTLVPHGDVAAWRKAVVDAATIVITESVFSMTGDAAPLDELTELCERTGAALVVDDAHSIGVLPARGRPVVRVNPCGKALAGAGAVVTGPRDVIEVLRSTCRTFLFTTAMPPSVAAGVLAALEIAIAEPWRGERAVVLARRLVPTASSPIVAVPCADNADALAAQEFLAARGLDVRAVRPPTVPHAMLRVSFHADRTEAEVDRLAEALAARRAGAAA